MLTLERFEEASDIVRKVTQETKLVYSEFLQYTDRKQGLFQAGKHAVDRSLQSKRCLL